MQPWEAMAFGGRKTKPGKKAENKVHLKLFQDRRILQRQLVTILDVLCMSVTLIIGSCVLLQSSHSSSQKAVAR